MPYNSHSTTVIKWKSIEWVIMKYFDKLQYTDMLFHSGIQSCLWK